MLLGVGSNALLLVSLEVGLSSKSEILKEFGVHSFCGRVSLFRGLLDTVSVVLVSLIVIGVIL